MGNTSRMHNNSPAPGVERAWRRTIEVAPGIHVPSIFLTDSEGQPLGVQYPLATDGDSVYAKDIDLANSSLGEFTDVSGSTITDLFDSRTSIVVATENPSKGYKELVIALQRPIEMTEVILSTPQGNFSNVMIIGKDASGSQKWVIDDSTNSTPYTSHPYRIAPSPVCVICIRFYTTNDVTLGFVWITKSIHVHASVSGVSELTGLVEDVKTFRGALSTSDGLRHKTIINVPFHRNDGTVDTTLAAMGSAGDTSIQVTDATGIIVGMILEIYTDASTGEEFYTVTDISAAPVIVLDRPLAVDLDAGHSVESVSIDMNVNGTLASPLIYRCYPSNSDVWQISRIIISMTDATAMDDGTFGGLAALTNGVVIRTYNNGVYQNLTNWKTNGGIANDMYDFTYVPKPPAGTGYGARGRWTFTNAEAIVELDGVTSDELQLLVQDDLTGLSSFRIKAQGRLFGG